jgi:hypothetical protein
MSAFSTIRSAGSSAMTSNPPAALRVTRSAYARRALASIAWS